MGYRELLKNYIRFLELHAGDNFIESIPSSRESILSERDLGELRAIAAEIFREAHTGTTRPPAANYNYRFRLLLNQYGIAVRIAARLAGCSEEQVRSWRTQPRSRRYQPMTEAEFDHFERRLARYLERGELPETGASTSPKAASRRGAAASKLS